MSVNETFALTAITEQPTVAKKGTITDVPKQFRHNSDGIGKEHFSGTIKNLHQKHLYFANVIYFTEANVRANHNRPSRCRHIHRLGKSLL